jgi:hypothetical protein
MGNSESFASLGIYDAQILKSKDKALPPVFFRAVITPPHPEIVSPSFDAGWSFYFGSETTFSLIGHHRTDNVFEIMSFVFDRSVEDGTHQIGGSDSKVQAILTMSGGAQHAKNGHIAISRDAVTQYITATFEFEVEFNNTLYRITDGTVSRDPTGPL